MQQICFNQSGQQTCLTCDELKQQYQEADTNLIRAFILRTSTLPGPEHDALYAEREGLEREAYKIFDRLSRMREAALDICGPIPRSDVFLAWEATQIG